MRPTRMLPVAAFLLLGLAGCTFAGPGDGVDTDAAADQSEQTVTIDPEAVVAALGPVPPDPELTDALLDDYLSRWLDWQWANVLRSYPDAVRPVIVEIARATGSNPAVAGCLDAAADADPQGFAVAGYVCSAEYPSLPNGTLSRDQARYLYDYWTRFVMPCYAAAGFADASTPPSRDFFAANWPFQNWSPQPMRAGQHLDGGPEYDTVSANCPGMPAGLDG